MNIYVNSLSWRRLQAKGLGVSCSYAFTSEHMQVFIATKAHLKKKKKKKKDLTIKWKWVTCKLKYWSDACGFLFKASAAALAINGSLEKYTPMLTKSNRQATTDWPTSSYMKKAAKPHVFLLIGIALFQRSLFCQQRPRFPKAAPWEFAGHWQAATSPCNNILKSASITAHAIVPSDLEWFKYS